MIKEFNMMIAGVGGQGLIVATEMLGTAAVSEGLSTKGVEMIGMAQRGGAVISVLRLGSAPQAPLIPLGSGDLMLGFEMAEALRYITYMSKSSFIVLNTQQIMPVPVLLGQSIYPSLKETIEKLRKNSARIVTLDAIKLALEAGSARSANMVMLGAAFGTRLLPIKTETIKATIQGRFTGQIGLSNIKGFDLGYQACQQGLK